MNYYYYYYYYSGVKTTNININTTDNNRGHWAFIVFFYRLFRFSLTSMGYLHRSQWSDVFLWLWVEPVELHPDLTVPFNFSITKKGTAWLIMLLLSLMETQLGTSHHSQTLPAPPPFLFSWFSEKNMQSGDEVNWSFYRCECKSEWLFFSMCGPAMDWRTVQGCTPPIATAPVTLLWRMDGFNMALNEKCI